MSAAPSGARLPVDSDVSLMAHLLRRAGFGGTRAEIETRCAAGYESTVHELLHPQVIQTSYGTYGDQDLVERCFPASAGAPGPEYAWPQWSWRLLTSPHVLQEKIALFWHGLLATGAKFPMHADAQLDQIEMFRQYGLGGFAELLTQLCHDPAMLVWLDNQQNTKDAPNENYGRELLELFTMGEGNYTEQDVQACARAFTGWGVQGMPGPYWMGVFPIAFVYDATAHDDGVKTFLGHAGNLNGQDVIAIIAAHPATARFVCDRLYRFFVADSPDDAGEREIERLTGVFTGSGGDIRTVLSSIFLSEHFRSGEVRYRKVSSPVELVFRTARLTERWTLPEHDVAELAVDAHFMGQSLLNPPSVEGWHEGEEWIDSAGLIERINFASTEIARAATPGVRRMVDHVRRRGPRLEPAELLTACLDALGAIEVSGRTRAVLESTTATVDFDADPATAAERTVAVFQAVVSTADYQYC